MRSLLATSFDQYRNTRSLLAISINLESHLAIPFNQSWNMRSLLATSFDKYRNTRSLLAISFNQSKNLFCKSVNLESHLAIPFYRSWYRCRSSWWKGLNLSFSLKKKILIGSSHFIVVPESKLWFFAIINPLILSSSIILLDYIKDSSYNDSKTYMQWFMIRCHACILTRFWNIGPIIFFYFMKLSLAFF